MNGLLFILEIAGRNGFAYLLQQFFRFLLGFVWKQQNKFLSAPAADGGFVSTEAAHCLGNVPQYVIPAHVPVGIVDPFEIVDIPHGHHGGFPGAALPQPLKKGMAAEQLGEIIVICQHMQVFVFLPEPLIRDRRRNVGEQGGEKDDRKAGGRAVQVKPEGEFGRREG